jgi:hypothetical protein
MDWKSILEKLIGTVIAGAILASIGWIISPFLTENQPVKGTIDWVEIRNPFTELLKDTQMSIAVGKVDAKEKPPNFLPLANIFGLNGVEELINQFAYIENFAVGNVTLTNESNVRSGEVEFSLQNGLIINGGEQSKIADKNTKVKLPPIEPRKSVSVYFVYSGYLWSFNESVQILHNNRIVEIVTKKTPEELLFFKPIVERYPTLVFFVLSIMAVLIVSVIFFLLVAFLVKDKIAYTAKQISRSGVEDYLKVIEYVKKHFPEKLPKQISVIDEATE